MDIAVLILIESEQFPVAEDRKIAGSRTFDLPSYKTQQERWLASDIVHVEVVAFTDTVSPG